MSYSKASHFEILPNGLKILLREVRQYPVVLFDMWVKCGARDEKKIEWGASHFLEHLVFTGSKGMSKQEYAKLLFRLGARDNASTDYDLTDFFIQGPSEHFDRLLHAHRTLVMSPILADGEFNREKDVILEEIRLYEDIPWEMLYEKSENLLLAKQGYNHPILGTNESITAMSPEQLRDYYRGRYSPDNMVLVVTGDFSIEEALEKIRSAYSNGATGIGRGSDGKISLGKEPVFEKVASEDQYDKCVMLTCDIDATYLAVYFEGPPITEMETCALDVLMEALGGFRSARLNNRLFIELGIVTDITAFNRSRINASLLGIHAELKDPENLKSTVDEINSILSDVRRHGFTETELEMARKRLHARYIFDRERLMGISEYYGQLILMTDLETAEKYPARILSVTCEQVTDVARRFLNPDCMVVGTNVPTGCGNYSISIDGLKSDEVKSSPPSVAHGTINMEFHAGISTDDKPRPVVREELSNGAVMLFQRNTTNPTVAVDMFVRGGTSNESRDICGATEMMHRALWKGTRTKNVRELNNEIDTLGARLEIAGGLDYLVVESLFLSEDFEKGIELVSEILLEPSFPEDEFEKVRDEVLGVICVLNDDMQRTALNRLKLEMYGAEHPYGRPIEGDVETVTRLRREDIVELHSRTVVPENIVVSIVGDIDEDDARKAVDRIFGSMKRSGRVLPIVPKPAEIPGLTRVKTSKGKSQVRIAMGRPGPSPTDPDFAVMKLMDIILGGTSYSRLFMKVREEAGLAYDVYSSLDFGRSSSIFYTYMGTAPESLEVAIEKIRDEYRRIGNEPVSDGEIADAIGYARGNLLTWRIGNEAIAESMGTNEVLGLPYDFDFRLIGEYPKIKSADIIRVAKKYADPDNIIISICGTDSGDSE